MKKTIAQRLDRLYEKQFIASAELERYTGQIRTLESLLDSQKKASYKPCKNQNYGN